MSSSYVDVNPRQWFYNDIVEASDIVLTDGDKFIVGIPYGSFMPGQEYLYHEITSSEGQIYYWIPKDIHPTADNPLNVYIDGVPTSYKELTYENGSTMVTLYGAPGAGSIVGFASLGVPFVDQYGRPYFSNIVPQYPKFTLQYASTYVFEPFERGFVEQLTASGQIMRRFNPTDDEWDTLTLDQIGAKYIGYDVDKYTISPKGVVIMPYAFNNVTCSITYCFNDGWMKRVSGKFKPQSPSVLHTNRFFPNARITRAEAFVLIDRLREEFYARFTDSDCPTNVLDEVHKSDLRQKIFHTVGAFPSNTYKMVVKRNGKQLTMDDYIEWDDHTIEVKTPCERGEHLSFYYKKDTSERFFDVGRDTKYLGGGNDFTSIGTVDKSWWASRIIAMENEKFDDGAFMFDGVPVGGAVNESNSTVLVDKERNPISNGDYDVWFMPESFMTRAQAIRILNRFRKWCLERFK